MIARLDFPGEQRLAFWVIVDGPQTATRGSFLLITKDSYAYFVPSAHEGKPVAVLKDQKLFLMGNIESAGLKTQLGGSKGSVISPVSQRSLGTSLWAERLPCQALEGDLRGRSVHVLKDIVGLC